MVAAIDDMASTQDIHCATDIHCVTNMNTNLLFHIEPNYYYGAQCGPCVQLEMSDAVKCTFQTELLLLLSGDIEQNPGPTTDTDMILGAIHQSKLELTSEINALRHDVSEIKYDLQNVKVEVCSLKTKVESLENQQNRCANHMQVLSHKVGAVESDNVTIQGDIQTIASQLENESGRVDYLERALIMMESNTVKDTLRIFGLKESESDIKSLESLIEEEVFAVMDEGERVQKSNISARRVGTSTTDMSRMTLVKFSNLDEKFKIFKYRDALRLKGIRVSNGLGPFQRQVIRDENARGFRAYFKNGKLISEPIVVEGEGRRSRRRVRTLDDRNREQLRNRDDDVENRVNDSVHSEQNTNVSHS